MSEGGKKSFAQFAAEQKFPGVEQDHTQRWSTGFKKLARSLESRRRGPGSARASSRSRRMDRRQGEVYTKPPASGRADYATPRSDGLGEPQPEGSQTAPSEYERPRKSQRSERSRRRKRKDSRRTDRERRRRSKRSVEVKKEKIPSPSGYSMEDCMEEGEESSPRAIGAAGDGVEPFHPSLIGPGPRPGTFGKTAEIPKEDEAREPPQGRGLGVSEVKKFAQPADSPIIPVPEETPPKGGASRSKPIAGGAAESGKEKESKMMTDFDLRCLSIYTLLVDKGVEMEITEILSHLVEDGQWAEAFSSLTRPKRAATGLGYLRLFENYLDWVKKESSSNASSLNPTDKEGIWLYLHTLTKEASGAYTPKSFLVAFRFLGEAFGYCMEAFGYQRVGATLWGSKDCGIEVTGGRLQDRSQALHCELSLGGRRWR